MASRWLRRFSFNTERLYNDSLKGWPAKAFACFVRYVLGFTFQAENYSGAESWTTTVKNGTNGALSGTDFLFTDATAASFVQADFQRWILIEDNTNPENSGMYLIKRVVSSSVVEIDFATAPTEFPTAASSLNWWIVGEDQELPSSNDWVRLQSRHTTGWAIQILHYEGFYFEMQFKVSVDGQWATTGKVLGDASGDSPLFSFSHSNGSAWDKLYVEADYDGEWFHCWRTQQDNGRVELEPSSEGFIVARITETESGRVDDEKLVFCGSNGAGSLGPPYDLFSRGYDSGFEKYVGMARYWDELSQSQQLAFMVDVSSAGYADSFVNENLFDVIHHNRRIGSKLELFEGTYLIADPQNYDNRYALLGKMTGHWTTRAFPTDPHIDWRYGYREAHALAVLSVGGTRNRMMVQDGIVVRWPGYSNGEV